MVPLGSIRVPLSTLDRLQNLPESPTAINGSTCPKRHPTLTLRGEPAKRTDV